MLRPPPPSPSAPEFLPGSVADEIAPGPTSFAGERGKSSGIAAIAARTSGAKLARSAAYACSSRVDRLPASSASALGDLGRRAAARPARRARCAQNRSKLVAHRPATTGADAPAHRDRGSCSRGRSRSTRPPCCGRRDRELAVDDQRLVVHALVGAAKVGQRRSSSALYQRHADRMDAGCRCGCRCSDARPARAASRPARRSSRSSTITRTAHAALRGAQQRLGRQDADVVGAPDEVLHLDAFARVVDEPCPREQRLLAALEYQRARQAGVRCGSASSMRSRGAAPRCRAVERERDRCNGEIGRRAWAELQGMSAARHGATGARPRRAPAPTDSPRRRSPWGCRTPGC